MDNTGKKKKTEEQEEEATEVESGDPVKEAAGDLTAELINAGVPANLCNLFLGQFAALKFCYITGSALAKHLTEEEMIGPLDFGNAALQFCGMIYGNIKISVQPASSLLVPTQEGVVMPKGFPKGGDGGGAYGGGRK